jgi:hypothetical protein
VPIGRKTLGAMRGGSALHEACAALLAGVVVAACSGRELSAGGDNGPGTPGFQHGVGAAAGSLAVSLSASATASCPGQCVELTPQIRGGIAPYTVRWSDGSPSGGGTREVCPTATTTYTAIVTDSSGSSGELPLPDLQAQASVTVTVRPACAGDGGTSDDAAAAADSGQGHEVCSESWSVDTDTWWVSDGAGVRVAIDGVGNLYVAATFTGTLNMAGQTFQSTGDRYRLLVVKLDPACRVLWAKAFGGPQASVLLAGLAADATGNVIVVGNVSSDMGGMGALVDFGSGPIGNSFNSSSAGVVFKLSPDGKGLWSHAYLASSAFSAVEDLKTTDVAVDPRGNTVFLASITGGASGSPSVDFGGGAVAFSWSLVELDANGQFVFDADASSIAGAAGTFQPYSLTTDSAGRIRVAGCEGSAGCQLEIVALDAGGHQQWVRNVSAAGYAVQWLSTVRVDANDELFTATTGGQPADGGWLFDSLLSKFSASGSPWWTPPAAIPEPSAFDDSLAAGWPGRLGVDPSGRALFASAFSGTADLGSVGRLTSAGGDDSAVLRFDAQGRLIGAGRWGGTGDEKPFDVAADVAGDAVIAGRSILPAAPDGGQNGVHYAIFVAKLGW